MEREVTFQVEEYKFSVRRWRVDWCKVFGYKPVTDCEEAKKYYYQLTRFAYKHGCGEKYRVVDSEGRVVVEDKL